VLLTSAGGQWGAFDGQFVPQEAGPHQVLLRCQENASELSTTILVQGKELEQIGRPVRQEVMEEIARVSRGKLINSHQIPELMQALKAIPDPPETVRRLALWSHPMVAGVLTLLLAVFWIGRKLVGVI
jgi:membrane glycosyltransferase